MVKIKGRYLERENDENILAVTDSISYKMIEKDLRSEYTFAFKNITAKEARKMINNNSITNIVGAVGHRQFAIDLNRVLNVHYQIPHGNGRERVHLTLIEGDYVIVISRISNRADTYDRRGGYAKLSSADDAMYTLARVVKAPKVDFVLDDVNAKAEV